MSDTNYAYPFDPTGKQAGNFITGEQQVLTPPPWRDYHFIIPFLAPFFTYNFKIRHLESGKELQEGYDYAFTHRFYGASKSTMMPIYGSILFLDKTLVGTVELDYQTIGGEWTIDIAQITKILSERQTNPRATTWERITGTPQLFPVIDHQWNLTDMVGMSEVREAIDNLTANIEQYLATDNMFRAHMDNVRNPHQVTKDQVGLDLVENYPISTRQQAIDGEHPHSYMTPQRTRQMYVELVKPITDGLIDINQRVDVLETRIDDKLNELATKAKRLEKKINSVQKTLSENNITSS